MKRLLGMVTALVIGVTGIGAAQDGMGLFRSPVFVLQPGIVRPFSTGASTEFNARVVTALPTSVNRLTIVAIVQWTPLADKSAGGKANSVAFVYGPVVNLINQPQFAFDIDGLFAYGPAATGNSDYTHKFLVEGDFFLKLGNLMKAKGHWNSLSLYAFLAYVISGLPSGVESKDRMVFLGGLSLPLAPWKK